MLKVYAASWCPHCVKTVNFLKKHGIPYEYINMDIIDPVLEQKIIEINGGDDWVIPTLEYNGKWCRGKKFNAKILQQDLKKLGVIGE